MSRNKLSDKILNVIIGVSLICILSCGVSKLVTGRTSFFGVKPMYVPTGSMEPTIHAKSFVLGVPTTADKVGIGDIVVYNRTVGGILNLKVVHRIVDITDEGYIFKGDNNEDADAPVNPEQIMYKIIAY